MIDHEAKLAAELELLKLQVSEIQRDEEIAAVEADEARRNAIVATNRHETLRVLRALKTDYIRKMEAYIASTPQRLNAYIFPAVQSPVSTATRRRSTQPVAVIAEELLRSANCIIPSVDLFQRLQAAGVAFSGAEPMRNMQSLLSKHDAIRNIKTTSGRGWGLMDRRYPGEADIPNARAEVPSEASPPH